MGLVDANYIDRIKLRAFAVAMALAAAPAQSLDAPENAWSCTAYSERPGDLGFLAKPVRYWQAGDDGFRMGPDGEIEHMPFRLESGGSLWVWTVSDDGDEDTLILAINSDTGYGAVLAESSNYALPAVEFSCRWAPWPH